MRARSSWTTPACLFPSQRIARRETRGRRVRWRSLAREREQPAAQVVQPAQRWVQRLAALKVVRLVPLARWKKRLADPTELAHQHPPAGSRARLSAPAGHAKPLTAPAR